MACPAPPDRHDTPPAETRRRRSNASTGPSLVPPRDSRIVARIMLRPASIGPPPWDNRGIARLSRRPRMKRQKLETLVREMLVELGEDPTREGLERTPQRVAEALQFLTSGYRTGPGYVPRVGRDARGVSRAGRAPERRRRLAQTPGPRST